MKGFYLGFDLLVLQFLIFIQFSESYITVHYKIPEDLAITTSRPDIFLFSKQIKRIVLVELTVPWETNIPKDHVFKVNKYYDLINELTKNGYVVSLYAVEVGARDIPAKSLYNLLKDLGLTRSAVERVSKAALVGSFRIWLGRENNLNRGESVTRVKCSLADSVCLTKEAQNTLHEFVEGIPALGIARIDKIHIDPIQVRIPNFSYNWSDITISGLENAIIDNVSINMDLNVMRILIYSDVVVDLYNEANGTVLFVHCLRRGPAKITIKNMQIEMLLKFDIVNDNGKHFMDITSYFHALDLVDDVHYQFDDIDNRDPKLSALLHRILNENWRIVVANFGGYLNKKFVDKIFQAVKSYMRSKPLEDLALY